MNKTIAEIAEDAFISSLGCWICRKTPAMVHHDRRMGGKRKYAPKVPLCENHHQPYSRDGLHKMGVKAFERLHGSVTEMSREVAKMLRDNGMIPTWEKRK